MSEMVQRNGVYGSRGKAVVEQFLPISFGNWTRLIWMKNLTDLFKRIFGNRVALPREGRWKEFNKHAILIAVGHYVNNAKHGHWQEFYDTGELMLEEFYDNGVMHGRFASYHLNGKLLSEGRYVNGRREGHFKVYNEAGSQVRSLLFVKNNLVGEVILKVEKAYESS